MIQQAFPSIGARLGFVVVVMSIGFFVVVLAGFTASYRLDQAINQRIFLLGQERSLHDFRLSIFESMILIDRIILEGQDKHIPELLALNEDSLGYFGRYQSTAQSPGLELDRYAADEYEPLVFEVRSEIFQLVSSYRANKIQQAQEERLLLLERHLPVLITFIDNSRELRHFALADLSTEISNLRQTTGISIAALFFATLLCVIITAVAVNRSIVKPIARLRHLVDHFMTTGQPTGLLTSSGYNDKDEVAHLTESFRSMTGQLLENRLQQEELVEELSQRNTELERFTYTVSHDLKSPLVTVNGFIGLLEKDIAAGDRVRANEDMHRIKSATDTMAALLEDLLELSRVGRQVHPSEAVSLTELSELVAETLQVSINDHGAVVEIQSDMPTVFVDKLRMGEVIQNLLENAIKFSGESNEPQIGISASQLQDRVVMRFRDNGIGIDPRYHDSVFGLFNRLDSKVPGTGVGLALVKRIVEIHGGEIWIESAGDGRGSTFCFTLPVSGGGGRVP